MITREIHVRHTIGLDQNLIDLAHKFFINLDSFNSKFDKVMKTLQDLKDDNQKLIDKVTALTSVELAAKALLDGQTATLQQLKDQLAAAIASGDPAAIDAVVTSLDQQLDLLDTTSADLAAAVTRNTPADPAAGGGDTTSGGGAQ